MTGGGAHRRRERRFYTLLTIAALVVAAVVVTRLIVDAVAAPVTPRALVIALDDRAKLEKARAYNRSLERESCTGRCPGPNGSNGPSAGNARRCAAPWAPARSVRTGSRSRSSACIATKATWTDPGLPYFGGLQFDLDFQRAYGRDYLRYFGTADQWPMSVQLAVAIRGYISRGFTPWPNTRRMCGL